MYPVGLLVIDSRSLHFFYDSFDPRRFRVIVSRYFVFCREDENTQVWTARQAQFWPARTATGLRIRPILRQTSRFTLKDARLSRIVCLPSPAPSASSAAHLRPSVGSYRLLSVTSIIIDVSARSSSFHLRNEHGIRLFYSTTPSPAQDTLSTHFEPQFHAV